eukprot:gb/GECG01009532.1/.p1 GENE.gb/GECG01009532.1/~~gb/GECG01009532.1/.p1  ORF type:complete len:1012 (+),score=100.52 gb/GECG01009532.1/:1-3036(+)
MRRALVSFGPRAMPQRAILSPVSARGGLVCFSTVNKGYIESQKAPRSKKGRSPSPSSTILPRRLPKEIFQTQTLEELEQYYRDNRSKLLQSDLGQLVGRILYVAKHSPHGDQTSQSGARKSPNKKQTHLVRDFPFFQEQVLPDIRGMLAVNLMSIGDEELAEATRRMRGLKRPLSGMEVGSLVLYLALSHVEDSNLWLMLVLMTVENALSSNGQSRVDISPSWTGAQTVQRLCYGFGSAGIGDNDPWLTRTLETLAKREREHLSPMGASQCAWGLFHMGSDSYSFLGELISKALDDHWTGTPEGRLSPEQLRQIKETCRGLLALVSEEQIAARRNLEAINASLASLSSGEAFSDATDENLNFTGQFAISAMCQPRHYPISTRKAQLAVAGRGASSNGTEGSEQLPYIPNPSSFGAPAFPYRRPNDLVRIYQTNREKIQETELARPLIAAVGSLRRIKKFKDPPKEEIKQSQELIDFILEDISHVSRSPPLAESMSLCISICELDAISTGVSVNADLLQKSLLTCLHNIETKLEQSSIAERISLHQLLSFATRLRHFQRLVYQGNITNRVGMLQLVNHIAELCLRTSLSFETSSFRGISLPLFLRSYHGILAVLGETSSVHSEKVLDILSHALKEGYNNQLNINDCIQLCEIPARLCKSLSSAHREAVSSVLRSSKDALFDLAAKEHCDGVQIALLSATVARARCELQSNKCVDGRVLARDLPALQRRASIIALAELPRKGQYDRLQILEALLRSRSFTQCVLSGSMKTKAKDSLEPQMLQPLPQTLREATMETHQLRLCGSIVYSMSKLYAEDSLDPSSIDWHPIQEAMQKISSSLDTSQLTPLMLSQQIFAMGQPPLVDKELVEGWCTALSATDVEELIALSHGRLLDVWEGLTNVWKYQGTEDWELIARGLYNVFEGIKRRSHTEQPLNASHLLRLCTHIKRLASENVPSDGMQVYIEDCQYSINALEASGVSCTLPLKLKSYSGTDRELRYAKRVLTSLNSREELGKN